MDSWSVAPVKNVVDLGVTVTIDSKLKFSTHINGIAAKAHKRANLIIRWLERLQLFMLDQF